MTQHFNIAKKKEINPFEDVKAVVLSEHSYSIEALRTFLDAVSDATGVSLVRRNGKWCIGYGLEHLDFVTLIKWHSPLRGKFYFKEKSVEFAIEDGTMICW